ncbi:MAG: hypothetical protein ACJ76I_14340 [Gaiellaceae bacterium]
MIDRALREYAETPDRFSAIAGTSISRDDDGRICILQGKLWASFSAPRFAEEELDDVIEHVHARVAPEKQQAWWIGPSGTPANLLELLRARGFAEPDDRVHELRAVVLTTPPAEIPSGVEVRRIHAYDDFLAAREVQWAGFDTPEERRALQRPHLRADYEESIDAGVPVGFLALLDGRPGATAMAVPSTRGVFLIAGATAPWARGNGLYRALVRARWEYAAECGTPALVTHAVVDTSLPILRRLGFDEVCTIWRLAEDR